MIPISIDNLLSGTVVESNGIEFMKDWNPERVLHTICAFANNINNIGGGYIVIGVQQTEGAPLRCVGVNPESIPKIDKELFQVCNLISPGYTPELSVGSYMGVALVVIWAPGGELRPYRCPVSLGKKVNVERAYYIRKLSDTVRANQNDEIDLVRRSSRLPFDDRINEEVPVTEIRRWLVHEFLTRIGSDVDFRNMDGLRLYRALRIVRGPDENIRPVNIGLLMFTEKPERYFRNAHIEIVNMPDPTGTDMTEEVFDGPVDEQIRMALRTIRGLYIREKVIKVPGQAEPLRVFNYPYEALEETLVNAVYHKDYMIPEPVKMYIHPDRIEVVNYPGPDRSITDDMIARCDMRCDVSLNGRLGDFLKELKLAEGHNTGIPKVIRSLEDNGSGMPTYLTDPERRFLRVTIPVHDLFLKDIEKPKPVKTSKYRAPEDTKVAILESLRRNGCQSGRELATSVGYSSVNNTFRRCLEELMISRDVEYMYPDNPKDSRQRICLSKR